MDTSKFAVKFFLQDSSAIAHDTMLPIFHRWIQAHVLPDHLLIDVADYAHVPEGPGTVLVSLEANIHLDHTDGRTGLLYVRKQPLAGNLNERIRAVLRSAVRACALLEEEPALGGKVKFNASEAVWIVNDRLAGPNTAAAFGEMKPGLSEVFGSVYGGGVTIEHLADASRLEAKIKAAGGATVAGLLKKLEAK